MKTQARPIDERWTTAPIKRTCDVSLGRRVCGGTTTHAYPARHVGWVPLCKTHAADVLPHCEPIDTLLKAGEVLTP